MCVAELENSCGDGWRVYNNHLRLVVIRQYLFLFLIKENDYHLLKGYCSARYKRFQQNSWLIERVFSAALELELTNQLS